MTEPRRHDIGKSRVGEQELGRIIATIDAAGDAYDVLIAAFRARITELGTCINSIDDVAMLPDGYAAKLLAKKPIKTIGRVSLGALLQVLGLKIVLVEDLNQHMEKLEPRTSQRQRIDAAYQDAHRSKAGLNRAKWRKLLITSSSSQRRVAATHAATIRWQKYRAEQARLVRRAENAKRGRSRSRRKLMEAAHAARAD